MDTVKKELYTIPLSVDSVTYSPDAQTVLALDRSDNMRIIDCRMVRSNEPTEWTLREESLRLGSDAGGDSVSATLHLFRHRKVTSYTRIGISSHIQSCWGHGLFGEGRWPDNHG